MLSCKKGNSNSNQHLLQGMQKSTTQYNTATAAEWHQVPFLSAKIGKRSHNSNGIIEIGLKNLGQTLPGLMSLT